jgi:iron(III) transport system permease protein
VKRERIPTYLLVAAVAFVIVGYILYPTIAVVRQSLETVTGDGWTLSHFSRFFSISIPANLVATWNSVWISLGSVFGAALLGIPLALFMTTYEFPGRRLTSALVMMPIVLPPLIGVLSFVFLLSESGFLPRGLHLLFGLDASTWSLGGAWGIVAVHAYSFYVFFYTFVSAALEGRDPSLGEAARSLGASRWMRMRRVTLPLLTPAIIGAALLVFMVSMASFSAPLLFGGEIRVLSVQIYQTKLSGDLELAATQTVMLSVISLGFLVLVRTWGKHRRNTASSKGSTRARLNLPDGAARLIVPPVAIGCALLAILPHLTLVLLSFTKQGTWTFRLAGWLPSEYTFDNYRYLLRVVAPLLHSLELAAIATLGNVVFGIAIGWLITSGRFRWGRVLDALVMLPWALPGTVVAINLISAFNTANPFSFGRVLVGSFWLLPIAYFVRNLPLVARAATSAFEQLDPALDEAARSLGAGRWLRLRRVTLPLIAPGVVGGSLLAFVTALGEFVSSVLLWVPSNQPISMAIFNEYREYNLEAAAAYGVVLIVVIGVVFVLTRTAFRERSAFV